MKDGGTRVYMHNGRKFFLDFRCDTETEGMWYHGYPGKSELVTDQKLLNELNRLFIIRAQKVIHFVDDCINEEE